MKFPVPEVLEDVRLRSCDDGDDFLEPADDESRNEEGTEEKERSAVDSG